jgi:hypothetical protein
MTGVSQEERRMEMEVSPNTLALAMRIAVLASQARERNEAIDIRREAERLVKDYPEAATSVDDVAKALEAEAAKGGTYS